MSFLLDQDWGDIDPSLRPTTSSLAPSTLANGNANASPDADADAYADANAAIDGKVTHKRTSEVWDIRFTRGTESHSTRKARVFGSVNTVPKHISIPAELATQKLTF